mmetsp:Transcript_51545/g.137572  ORF Transcript_51545/g.137572 Transcript_51545/m.137572 type:complete len:147 (-) Transcript_51545:346-786(-)
MQCRPQHRLLPEGGQTIPQKSRSQESLLRKGSTTNREGRAPEIVAKGRETERGEVIVATAMTRAIVTIWATDAAVSTEVTMAVQVQEGMTDTVAARMLMEVEVQEEEEVEKEAVVIMEELTAETGMVVVTAPTAATVERSVWPCAP